MLCILITSFESIYSEVISEDNWTVDDEKLCKDDYDCQIDYNICISGVCRCDINYRLEEGKCQHFKCENNTQCQTYDQNRICESETCICADHYELNHDKRMCQIKDNQMVWLLVLAFLPLVLVLMSCWYCYKTAKSKNIPDDIPTEPPTPQTPQIIITDFQSLQSYPNLEEFFMSSKSQRFMSSNSSLNSNNNKEITQNRTDSNGSLDAFRGDHRVGLT